MLPDLLALPRCSTFVALILVCVGLPVVAGGVPDAPPGKVGSTPGVVRGVAVADVDADGGPDVVVLAEDASGAWIDVHRGPDFSGAVHRRAPVLEFVGRTATPRGDDFVAGDVDTDGRPDLVYVASSGTALVLRRGQDDGRWGPPEVRSLGVRIVDLAIGEVGRRDRAIDVAVLLEGADTPVRVWRSASGAWDGPALELDGPAGLRSLRIHERRPGVGSLLAVGPVEAREWVPDATGDLGPGTRRLPSGAEAELAREVRDAPWTLPVRGRQVPLRFREGSVLPELAGLGAPTITVNDDRGFLDPNPEDGTCDTALDPPDQPEPSGICTLAAALQTANARAGVDRIEFSIGGGGAQTIGVTSAMQIEEQVIIDGSSQPGFSDSPLIRLDHAGGGLIAGLDVRPGADDVFISDLSITGFPVEAIAVQGDRATVVGCWLGVDTSGVVAGNFRGIGISGDDAQIGTSLPFDRNVIAGNTDRGIAIAATASGVVVVGNRIGTDPSGETALGNGNLASGITVEGPGAQIGDGVPGAGNLISGHDGPGIRVQAGASDASILGNRIGTDADGLASLPNGYAGILVEGTTGFTIGGATAISGNLVSGNAANSFGQGGFGIDLAGVSNAVVRSNLVGVDESGIAPLGNALSGLLIRKFSTQPSDGVDVGSSASPNVFSANGDSPAGGHGVLVQDSTAVAIHGNFVGTDRDGAQALGNADDGIRFDRSDGSGVGGLPFLGTGEPNVIAHNGGAGIAILDPDTTPNALEGIDLSFNRIWDNGGLGIDLATGSAPDGVTANDTDDPDEGANRQQNFPSIGSVIGSVVSGSIDAVPSSQVRVELFESEACDPSGFGEARFLVGYDVVDVPAGGADGSFSVDAGRPTGILTATATDLATGDTSELSPCFSPGSLLGNRVWSDLDGDGIQAEDEPGISEVVVELRNGSGALLESTVTDADGYYGFAGLASGDYRLSLVLPVGAIPSPVDASVDDGVDNDFGQDPAWTAVFTYTAGDVDLSRDAGLILGLFSDDFESGNTSAWSGGRSNR